MQGGWEGSRQVVRLGRKWQRRQWTDFDDDDRTIIELYEKATTNAWTERDQAFLAEVRQFGVPCLSLAVATGRNRYRQKINSFRFFENNIREAAAMQPDKIERELQFQVAMLRRRVRL